MNKNWESSIIIQKTKENFKILPSVGQYITQQHYTDISKLNLDDDVSTYLKRDSYPIPLTEDREGYFDDRHYDFWLDGLSEFLKIKRNCERASVIFEANTKILDFGCATGRVLRHFALQSIVECWGCDINENHVIWCNRYLPPSVKVFQNSSLPHLMIEENFFDVIYCLSVFTHIETFETSWLCEIRRVLKKGGIAYVTIHDETSWENMPKDWGVGYALTNHPEFQEKWLKEGFPNEKFVSRWQADKSYSSNVFYKIDYIRNVWGKFFNILDIIPMGSNYQTVLILQKQ
ncbi:MAG: class I SAM-dependent methyltransferase [Bacteroidota bacterium]